MMSEENRHNSSRGVAMKSFYDRGDGQQPEVRRFSIDADVSTSFRYLEEKLKNIYPDLNGRAFRVTWKG